MPYVAQPYVAGTPEAEVRGETMIAFSENLEAEAMQPILEQYGAANIQPDQWYSHQLWMDILKALETHLGNNASQAFVAFGRKVVETAAMPDAIQSIPDALNALHAIHHVNLRNVPQEEGYAIAELGEKHYVVYHNTPNPEDAIYGFLWGMAARFKGPGEIFRVKQIANDRPDTARSAYEIRWGASSDKFD